MRTVGAGAAALCVVTASVGLAVGELAALEELGACDELDARGVPDADAPPRAVDDALPDDRDPWLVGDGVRVADCDEE